LVALAVLLSSFPGGAPIPQEHRRPLSNASRLLLVSVDGHDLDGAKKSLAQGADVNARNENGWTPLHIAVRWGYVAVAEFLIEKGALVDARNDAGETPLYYARETRIVTLLLTNGAAVNAVDKAGKAPLHMAAGSWTTKEGVVALLLANGAVINAMDAVGRTPLHVAASEGEKDTAELLLSNGAVVNAVDKAGRTPLHAAASTGHEDVAVLLLAKGANINAADQLSLTPLGVTLHEVARYEDELRRTCAAEGLGNLTVDQVVAQKDPDIIALNIAIGALRRRECADMLRKHGAKE